MVERGECDAANCGENFAVCCVESVDVESVLERTEYAQYVRIRLQDSGRYNCSAHRFGVIDKSFAGQQTLPIER